MSLFNHENSEVNHLLILLTDALCQWERETGRRSVLILKEQGGFKIRALDGKCNIPDDLPDELILKRID
jgi:hypothetical protein